MKTSDLVRIERKLDTISRLHKFGGICKVYRFFEAERFGNPAGLISQLIAVRFRAPQPERIIAQGTRPG